MKFLVDAHLPKKLALLLQYRGYDAKHTLDLPEGNYTKDGKINQITIEEERVLISKDLDFVESLLISNKPYKLICITTGNISNKELLEIFAKNLDYIAKEMQRCRYMEITAQSLIVKF